MYLFHFSPIIMLLTNLGGKTFQFGFRLFPSTNLLVYFPNKIAGSRGGLGTTIISVFVSFFTKDNVTKKFQDRDTFEYAFLLVTKTNCRTVFYFPPRCCEPIEHWGKIVHQCLKIIAVFCFRMEASYSSHF